MLDISPEVTCKAANTYVSGGTIRKLLYGFLFAFRSNYGRNLNYVADKATCWSKIAIFSQSLAFDAPLRGSYRKIAIMFGMEKLEWCGYLMVKKIEDMFSGVARIPAHGR